MSERKSGRPADYLRHILDALRKIERYTDTFDESAFFGDEKTQDAVIRNLEIVGEASRRILDEHPQFSDAHPAIPWKTIYAMRNRLSHGYVEVNLELVWETVRRSLPELKRQVSEALAREDGGRTGH